MKKKWNAVTIVTICLLLALSLAACGSKNNDPGSTGNNATANGTASPDPSPTGAEQEDVYPENGLPKNEKVTLKFAYWENGMGREWIDYTMDTFTKKFPNVSFETTYSPTIKTITGTKIAANNDDDMFDIFAYSLPGADDPLNLAKAGKLEPQDDLWDRKGYDGNGRTIKELAQPGTFETSDRILEKTYALPILISGTGLFYNKSLFEKHGWNEDPKTWSEFVQLLDDIKAKDIIPITFPGKYPDYLYYNFGFHKFFEMTEINGNLKTFEENYRAYNVPYYESPESIELHNRIYELGKKGVFPQGVAALSHTQSQMQLLQGQAAMATTGVWVENEMKDSIPDGFRWGFMTPPMSDDPESTKWLRMPARGQYYIWANKPELNKKWAKEFIVWMWNMDVQQMLGEKAGSVPIRSDYMDDQARADKLQGVIKEMLHYMSTHKIRGESGAREVTLLDPAAEQAKKFMLESLINIASGKQDPLPKLQEAEALLKKAVEAQK